MITLAVIYFFVVFRTDKPPTPPSAAGTVKKEALTEGMLKDTFKLMKNVNYVLVLAIFTLIYTIYAGLGFVISPLFAPYEYSPTQVSIFGMCFVLCGCVSTIFVGIYLDKTKKYLLVLRAIPISATFIFLMTMLTVPAGEFYLTLVVVTFGGICSVPIIAVCYQLATELTHPVQPALVLGLMMSCA